MNRIIRLLGKLLFEKHREPTGLLKFKEMAGAKPYHTYAVSPLNGDVYIISYRSGPFKKWQVLVNDIHYQNHCSEAEAKAWCNFHASFHGGLDRC